MLLETPATELPTVTTPWSLSCPGLREGLRQSGKPAFCLQAPACPALPARPPGCSHLCSRPLLQQACLVISGTDGGPAAHSRRVHEHESPLLPGEPAGSHQAREHFLGAPCQPRGAAHFPVSLGGLESWPAGPGWSQDQPETVPSLSHSGYETPPVLPEQPGGPPTWVPASSDTCEATAQGLTPTEAPTAQDNAKTPGGRRTPFRDLSMCVWRRNRVSKRAGGGPRGAHALTPEHRPGESPVGRRPERAPVPH